MRPNSGANEDVCRRNSSIASTATRLLEATRGFAVASTLAIRLIKALISELAGGLPPTLSVRNPGPIGSEALPLPIHNRVRIHHVQGPSPRSPDSRKHRPEQ